jgi:hypothetical protein
MSQNANSRTIGRFLLELHPESDAGFEDIQALSDRSRAACDEVPEQSGAIRFLRSLFIPEDGSCLLLFEASSAVDVLDAVRRAGMPAGPVWELSRG